MRDDFLSKTLSELTQKLNELHIALSQQVLSKATEMNNFDEVVKKNQHFLMEYKKKFGKFKKHLVSFIKFLEMKPKNKRIKESTFFKNLIQARNALPTTEEITQVIISFNQFKDINKQEVDSIIQFLNELKFFLDSAIRYINEFEDEHSDIFDKHKIDFVDLTSYFKDLEEQVNTVISEAISKINE